MLPVNPRAEGLEVPGSCLGLGGTGGNSGFSIMGFKPQNGRLCSSPGLVGTVTAPPSRQTGNR